MRSAWWLATLIGIQLAVLFSYIHYNSAAIRETYAMGRYEHMREELLREHAHLTRSIEAARNMSELYEEAKQQGMSPNRIAQLVYLPSFDAHRTTVS